MYSQFVERNNHIQVVRGIKRMVKEHGLSPSIRGFISSEDTLKDHLDLSSSEACIASMEGFIEFIKNLFKPKWDKQATGSEYIGRLEGDAVDRFAFEIFGLAWGYSGTTSNKPVKVGRQLIDKYLNPAKADLATKFQGFTVDQACEAFTENTKILQLIMALADEFIVDKLERSFSTEIKKMHLKYATYLEHEDFVDPFPYGKNGKTIGSTITVAQSGWFDKKKLAKLDMARNELVLAETRFSSQYCGTKGALSGDDSRTPSVASDEALLFLRDASSAYHELTIRRFHMMWIEYIAAVPIAQNIGIVQYTNDTKLVDGIPV